MKIITDNKQKPFKYRNEVPKKILESEFDWATPEEDYFDGFIQYRGFWYHTSQFLRNPPNDKWDGTCADSAFSGVAIKLSDDGESYKIATLLT